MRVPLFFIIFFACNLLSAQEICNNGIDDDADQLIDCFDPDCGCDTACASHYYKECPPDCQYTPENFVFSMTTDWTYSSNWHEFNVPIVGDLDGDGDPELVGKSGPYGGDFGDDDLVVVDGVTGSLETTIQTPLMRWVFTGPCIGDVNNNGYPEIIIAAADFSSNASYTRIVGGTSKTDDARRRLFCYEFDGTDYEEIWMSDRTYSYFTDENAWSPNLADFNGDGKPEVYIGNQIFDAQTGKHLVDAGATAARGITDDGNFGRLSAFTIAVDALPTSACTDCSGLELVAGNTVYSVYVDASGMGMSRITPELVMTGFLDGFTSIADMDGDGDIDAVVARDNEPSSDSAVIYVWDLQTATLLYPAFKVESGFGAGASGHVSQVNIADFDGDGQNEMGVCVTRGYHVIDVIGGSLSLLWSLTTTDNSGQTGSTVFDFDGDADYEVVYRDQTSLRILNGADGTLLVSTACASGTRNEYPVVADVDNDGETEIACSCGSQLQTFKSNGLEWVPTRNIWNQHSYFNSHITDDLKIPKIQQKHHLVGDSLILNNFLTQANNLYYPETNGQLEILDYSCSGNDLIINLRICNIGDDELLSGTDIQLYDANPFSSAAASLGSLSLPSDLEVDSCVVLSITIPFVEGQFIFAQLNDDGTKPSPLDSMMDFPITNQRECDYFDNQDSLQMGRAWIEPDTSFCEGGSVVLSAGGGVDYNWSPTLGLSDPSASDPLANPTSTTTYTCAVTLLDGCVIDKSVTITIYYPGTTDAGPDQTLTFSNNTTTLSGTGGGTYEWIPPTYLSDPFSANTDAQPEETTTYVLKTVSAEGCVDYDTVTLFVLENQLALPNVFTPNGDGLNDIFSALAFGEFEEVEFKIFNRWGSVVFETNSIDEGWDGTFKGKDQEVGVYVFTLKAIDEEGLPIFETGNFSLIR